MVKTPEPHSTDSSLPNGIVENIKCKTKTRNAKLGVNKATLPLKITLFLYYGAMAAILPYLTIHMQAIGISITKIAIIYAVLPFTSFVGPPILGFLADKIGNYKWVLILSTFGNGFCYTLLLAVPNYYPPSQINSNIYVKWNASDQRIQIVPVDSNQCHLFNPTSLAEISSNFSLYNCRTFDFEIQNTASPELSKNLTDETTSEFMKTSLEYTDYQILTNRITSSNCSSLSNLSDLGDWSVMNENLKSDVILCKSMTVINTPEIGNAQLTFWTYFVLRILATIFMSSCFSLLDATTLAVVKRCGEAEYGKERIWSIFGTALTSPIAGVLVDHMSKGKGYVDYSAAFYVADVLLITNIITFFFFNLEVDSPGKGILRNAMKLLKHPEVAAFLIMIFVLGNLWGFVESYLFVFLKELHAPNYLLGLTLTVGALIGLPFLWGSERIVVLIGRVNLILIAFFTYFVRFFGYSYLQNPFWCFPYEAMEAITYHLMWTAAATYCSVLAPKGMLASLMGIMSSLHYSLGKGSGSFFGGIVYGHSGARAAFRYFGITAGVFGFIFLVLDYFWIRKHVQKKMGTTSGTSHANSIESPKLSSRRLSIIDANPLANTTSLLSLHEVEDSGNDESVQKMLSTHAS